MDDDEVREVMEGLMNFDQVISQKRLYFDTRSEPQGADCIESKPADLGTGE